MDSSLKIKPMQKCSDLDAGLSAQPARVSSQVLLGSRGELIIDHDGREYRLRLTQNGKLILTA
jgi:hemin uptake protein HemP